MKKIERVIRGTKWSGYNISGTISLNSDVTVLEADRMAPALVLAESMGMTTDVFAGHSEPGRTEVTLQFPASRISALAAWCQAIAS